MFRWHALGCIDLIDIQYIIRNRSTVLTCKSFIRAIRLYNVHNVASRNKFSCYCVNVLSQRLQEVPLAPRFIYILYIYSIDYIRCVNIVGLDHSFHLAGKFFAGGLLPLSARSTGTALLIQPALHLCRECRPNKDSDGFQRIFTMDVWPSLLRRETAYAAGGHKSGGAWVSDIHSLSFSDPTRPAQEKSEGL